MRSRLHLSMKGTIHIKLSIYYYYYYYYILQTLNTANRICSYPAQTTSECGPSGLIANASLVRLRCIPARTWTSPHVNRSLRMDVDADMDRAVNF